MTEIRCDQFNLPLPPYAYGVVHVHNVHPFENKVYTTFIAIGDSLNVTLKHENNI